MASKHQKITIRFHKAGYSDVNFLLYLRKVTMDEHLSVAGIVMTDEQHTARVLEHFDESYLIVIGEITVGVIKFGFVNASLHIRQLQILPEYQGKGIGKHVLDVCKKKAREKACSLTLNVLKENPAKALYERNGFQVDSSDELQCFMRCHVD